MKLIPEALYHIYNRGNQKQPIFFQERNFEFFKKKVHSGLNQQLDILAYCLMPNHFHFLVFTKPSFDNVKFSNAFRVLLSSYTRAIQKQENFIGSLFQQNSKAKEISNRDYAPTCFHYIHQNPLRSGLIAKLEDWPHHSFSEYWNDHPGICNTKLGRELLDLPESREDFYRESYEVIRDAESFL
jgi:REP element-mobilizing transposase RayT